MRRLAKESKSQQQVWNEVESKSGTLSVPGCATGTYQSIVTDRDVKLRADPYLREFKDVPALVKDAVGVAVVAGGEIVCVDVFSDAALFRAMWPKLLSSYIMDALDRGGTRRGPDRAGIGRFIRGAAGAGRTRSTTDGVGQAWELSGGGAYGSALVYNDAVVHCDLFPGGSVGDCPDDGEAPRLQFRRERGKNR
jgi:hypothetical protein